MGIRGVQVIALELGVVIGQRVSVRITPDWGGAVVVYGNAPALSVKFSNVAPRGPVPSRPEARLALWLTLDALRLDGKAVSHRVLRRWSKRGGAVPEW